MALDGAGPGASQGGGSPGRERRGHRRRRQWRSNGLCRRRTLVTPGFQAVGTAIWGGVVKEEGPRPTTDQGVREMGPVRDPPDHPPQPMSAHCAATSVGWRDSFLPDTSPCRATGSCGKLVQTASLLEDLDGGPQWPGGPRSGPLSLRRLAAPACQRPAWQRQPSQAGGSQMTPGKCDGPDPQPGILRWCPALGWCQCPTIPIATPRLILGRRCRNSCVRLQTRNGLTCTGWGGDG